MTNTANKINKLMTRSLVTAAVASMITLPAAAEQVRGYSDYGNSTVEYARVVDVKPIVETYQVNDPIEQCWDERVPVNQRSVQRRDYRSKSKTPEILGAILGGAIGNQVGKRGGGKARDVATVAGAVLGGSIGRDVKHKNSQYRDRYNDRYERVRYETVQRCDVKDRYVTKEQVVGYDVAYKYRGDVFHTQMNQHPGKKIKVKVTVNPV